MLAILWDCSSEIVGWMEEMGTEICCCYILTTSGVKALEHISNNQNKINKHSYCCFNVLNIYIISTCSILAFYHLAFYHNIPTPWLEIRRHMVVCINKQNRCKYFTYTPSQIYWQSAVAKLMWLVGKCLHIAQPWWVWIHLGMLVQRNWSGEQVDGQTSSEPSPQSFSLSHTHWEGMQRPPAQVNSDSRQGGEGGGQATPSHCHTPSAQELDTKR